MSKSQQSYKLLLCLCHLLPFDWRNKDMYNKGINTLRRRSRILLNHSLMVTFDSKRKNTIRTALKQGVHLKVEECVNSYPSGNVPCVCLKGKDS